MLNKRIWITWESQRRSVELAKALNCDFYQLDYDGLLRYPRCIFVTIIILLMNRYKVVFVQNPSMILAALVCIYKILIKTKIIVDRHTTFRLNKKTEFNLEYLVFKILNRFSIEYANLTIVTNKYLASIIEDMNGNAFELADKLPEIKKTEDLKLKGKFNMLLISSFGEDEPIVEVLEAMEKLTEENIMLYISGNPNKLKQSVKNKASSNIVFTGYLDEEDYMNHLFAADAIVVLTTAEYCMLCGCYEAVSVAKPLITSKKNVLQEYFKGSIFVDNTSEDILGGIKELTANYCKYVNNAEQLKQKINNRWQQKFQQLEEIVKTY